MADFGVNGLVADVSGSELDLAEDERGWDFWAIATPINAVTIRDKKTYWYFAMEISRPTCVPGAYLH